MENPEDVETTPLTKPKQTRRYEKTPAREEAIKRMIEGKKKKAELNQAEKVIKAYETKQEHEKLKKQVKEELEISEDEEDAQEPAPPVTPKKIVKKVIKKPTKVIEEVEEEESEEEVIVVKKKPKKKKVVYVSESEEEEEPIVKQSKEREMKSQKTAKSTRQSVITVGGAPRQSREDFLSNFV